MLRMQNNPYHITPSVYLAYHTSYLAYTGPALILSWLNNVSSKTLKCSWNDEVNDNGEVHYTSTIHGKIHRAPGHENVM